MTDVKGRPVLLIGSVPLSSSKAVFEAVGTKLGKLVKRIPDGETGARKDWVVWQGDVFKNAKGLEPGNTRELQGGYHFILYKVKPGETVKFGPLGYAAAAIQSYEDFKRARSEGKIATGTRFQVSLPTPIAVVMTFTDPQSIQQVWPIYEARLNEEVAEIAAAIPHRDLAIQWDIAAEICFVLENPEMVKLIPMEPLVASIARVSEHVRLKPNWDFTCAMAIRAISMSWSRRTPSSWWISLISLSSRSNIRLPGFICRYRGSERTSPISHRSMG